MHILLGWYTEFLLKIILQFLFEKIAARLIFKIMLKSLHIGPGLLGNFLKKKKEENMKTKKTKLGYFCIIGMC